MARALKKISWKQVALITAIGFAWTKLGVGVAASEIMPTVVPRPGTGVRVWPNIAGGCPAGYYLSADGTYCVQV